MGTILTATTLIAAAFVDSARAQPVLPPLRVPRTSQWTSIGPQGGQIWALSVDPHNPGTLYAATYSPSGNGVAFKSLDAGANWVITAWPNASLVFDPQDPNTIYALSNGISKSTDGGKNWNTANSGLPPRGFDPPAVLALAVDPVHHSTLYAGTELGLFKSTDAGASWTSAGSGLPVGPVGIPTAHSVNLVVVNPQNPSTLYASAEVPNAPGASLFKSTDGGATWNPTGWSVPQKPITLAIDPQNPATLYADTFFGTLKSTDGGASWNAVNSGLPLPGVAPALAADSLVVDPQQPGTIYVAKSTLSGGKVFKTTNAGASWTEAASGLPQGFINSLKIDTRSPATLYVGTTAGVYKTVDGGANWTAVNSGLTSIPILDIAAGPRSSRTLYAATSNGFFKTTDGGLTWSRSSYSLGPPIAIDQNTGAIFATGCNAAFQCGVARSTDEGESWNVTGMVLDFAAGEAIESITINPRNSNVLYATTSDSTCFTQKLYKSVDGGSNWSASKFPDMSGSMGCVIALAVDPRDSANLYATFSDGGVFKSTDTGATWNASNSGLSAGTSSRGAFAVAIDPHSPDTVYTVTRSGVFKSLDGAVTWNRTSAGLPDWSAQSGAFFPRLAVDPGNSSRLYLGVAVGAAGRVFESVDGGASWLDSGLSAPANSGFWGGLAITSQDPDKVYAGTGAGVFVFSLPPRAHRDVSKR